VGDVSLKKKEKEKKERRCIENRETRGRDEE